MTPNLPRLALAALPALALGLAPGLAAAHPHIFIDTKVQVVFDADGLAAIRLTWVYDDFFSLLLTEDIGIDDDLDGELTEAELQQLADYVLAWPDGYTGDLVVLSGDRTLPIGDRSEMGVAFTEGRMTETHTRPVSAPADTPITIRVYDEYYYTAYTIVGPVEVIGRDDCTADINRADIMAATDMVEEMLFNMPQSQTEEMYPMVGESFADTIIVTCAGSS